MEECVPGEHNLVITVLHQIADAVLGMAWGVQRLDGDVANAEGLAVLRRLGHLLAILPADHLEFLAEL